MTDWETWQTGKPRKSGWHSHWREPSLRLWWVHPVTPGVCLGGVTCLAWIVGRGQYAFTTLSLVLQVYVYGKSVRCCWEIRYFSSPSTWFLPWDFCDEWRFWSIRISLLLMTRSLLSGELEPSVRSADCLGFRSFRSTRGYLARCLQSQHGFVWLAAWTAKHTSTGTQSSVCHRPCICSEKELSFPQQS